MRTKKSALYPGEITHRRFNPKKGHRLELNLTGYHKAAVHILAKLGCWDAKKKRIKLEVFGKRIFTETGEDSEMKPVLEAAGFTLHYIATARRLMAESRPDTIDLAEAIMGATASFYGIVAVPHAQEKRRRIEGKRSQKSENLKARKLIYEEAKASCASSKLGRGQIVKQTAIRDSFNELSREAGLSELTHAAFKNLLTELRIKKHSMS